MCSHIEANLAFRGRMRQSKNTWKTVQPVTLASFRVVTRFSKPLTTSRAGPSRMLFHDGGAIAPRRSTELAEKDPEGLER
jgi:hypothetical protein